jgi:hypothetical protein
LFTRNQLGGRFMSTMDHIEALKAKHASLEQAIDQENTRPHPDDDAICSLKKRKLQIKDEIARLLASSHSIQH